MKTPVASLLLILLSASLLPAQDIPKGANTIIITGEFDQGQKFAEVTALLFESGIGTISADKDAGTITTSPKSFKNGTVSYMILVRDSRVSIRGQWISNTFEDKPQYDIEYGGQRNSAKRNAWDAFRAFTDQIPGEKSYVIK